MCSKFWRSSKRGRQLKDRAKKTQIHHLFALYLVKVKAGLEVFMQTESKSGLDFCAISAPNAFRRFSEARQILVRSGFLGYMPLSQTIRSAINFRFFWKNNRKKNKQQF